MSAKLEGIEDASPTKRRYVLLGVIVALIVIVLFLDWARHTTTYIKATTHQPETFTELYFSNPNSLPSSTNSGSNIPVNFTIHNEEAKTVQYTYDINATDSSGTTTLLAERKVTLQNNQLQQVKDKSLLPKSMNGRVEIGVVLKGKPESIHYWVEVNS